MNREDRELRVTPGFYLTFPLWMVLTLGMNSGGGASLLGERVVIVHRRSFNFV